MKKTQGKNRRHSFQQKPEGLHVNHFAKGDIGGVDIHIDENLMRLSKGP